MVFIPGAQAPHCGVEIDPPEDASVSPGLLQKKRHSVSNIGTS